MLEEVEDDVKKLIDELTHYKRDGDYQSYVDFILCHILNVACFHASEIQIIQTLKIFSEKYNCNGFPDYSQNLTEAFNEYLDSYYHDKEKEQYKLHVIKFLLCLSSDAFKTETLSLLDNRLKISRIANLPEEIYEGEKINWFQYLQEGSEKFQIPFEETESSDEESVLQNESCVSICLQKPNISKPKFNDLFSHFDEEVPVVNHENVEFRKALKDAVDSKSWLMQNLQHSWWNSKDLIVPQSIYSSANFGIKWERKQNNLLVENKQNPTNYQYLSEYKIIREIFWLFIGGNQNIKRIETLRFHISLPSLIQETFRSLIDDLFNRANEYHQLVYYCDTVLSNDLLQTSFSLQAYASAIKDIYQCFLYKIIDLENLIKKHDTIFTLLNVQYDLSSHLKEINFLYAVHLECVTSDWSEQSSWMTIVRLLSVLFYKYQNLISTSLKKILLRIFFKTFKVYADIIDSWMTEGKLNDWKNEFFIKKSNGNNEYIAFPYENEMKNISITIAPFFYKISATLIKCSQSIEFLCKLNKMHDLRFQILKEGKLIDCLINEFKNHLHCSNCTDLSKPLELEEEPIFRNNTNPCIVQSANGIYLFQAFSENLYMRPVHMNEDKHTSLQQWEFNLINAKFLPAAPVLEKILCNTIGKREAVVVNFFRSCIVDDYDFFKHVRNLSELLLMNWNRFCCQVIVRPQNRLWMNNNSIKVLLYDCVENSNLPFGDLLRFTIDDDQNLKSFDVSVCSVIKTIDHISLHYEVQWPMNMIFTNDLMKNFYTPLLKLILKINIAFSCVMKLQFKDLPQMKLFSLRMRRIQIFRYWVILLLQKIRVYLSSVVAHNLDWKLIKNSVEMNTFSSLQIDYSNYHEKIKRNCLTETEINEYLNRALNRMWRVCDDVIELWTKAMKLQITDQDLYQSVELYLQCLWYLSKVLQKFVKDKRNSLYDLCTDLCYMAEMHKSVPEDLSFKYAHQSSI